MALPDVLTGLLRPAAYPHPSAGIRVVETHISWVLLTGDYAYKIKKPVRFPFVDFGSIERRRFFCLEELRCNARFAPELYLDVVPVRLGADGLAAIGVPPAAAAGVMAAEARAQSSAGTGAEAASGTGAEAASGTGAETAAGTGAETGAEDAVEWAVRMRQFPPEQELDRLLEAGALTTALLRDFGMRLGALHLALPRRSGGPAAVESGVLAPVAENFATLAALEPGVETLVRIRAIQEATASRARDLHGRFTARIADGFTRECHGDLHLGNLVLIDGVVTAFDCLEFDANLRWIDTQSDVAFLFMDCLVRGRADLGYAFLDGYLDTTGDYEGVVLLPFYAVYRALVRAKVAAIQSRQAADAAADGTRVASLAAAGLERMLAHLRWAQTWLARPPGRMVLMSGVSGSGKSYLAGRLVPLLPAVRIRTDVARRHSSGTPADAEASEVCVQASGVGAGGHSVDAGRYAPAQVLAVYRYVVELAFAVVGQGESVIVDATFIDAAARRMFLERAGQARWHIVIVACRAPRALLETRIRERLEQARDPSEADLAVLERQLARQDPFGPDEPVLDIDTSLDLDAHRLAGLVARIAGSSGAART